MAFFKFSEQELEGASEHLVRWNEREGPTTYTLGEMSKKDKRASPIEPGTTQRRQSFCISVTHLEPMNLQKILGPSKSHISAWEYT